MTKLDLSLVCSANIGVNASGVPIWYLKYYDNSGEHDVLSTVPVAGNASYLVEMKFKQGTGSGEVSLWVNGILIVNASGLTNTNYAPQTILIGTGTMSGLPIRIYSDDVVASTSYIGPKNTWSNVTKVLNSIPGTSVGWKIFANDSSNNWNVQAASLRLLQALLP
jgi:hypothetical protein